MDSRPEFSVSSLVPRQGKPQPGGPREARRRISRPGLDRRENDPGRRTRTSMVSGERKRQPRIPLLCPLPARTESPPLAHGQGPPKHGLSRSRIHFRLEKRIPAGGGLGGGSSDVAAGLRLLSRLPFWKAEDRLVHTLALACGSDCPLFLQKGPVRMEGRGEKISRLGPEMSKRLSGVGILLIIPPWSCSTPRAFQSLACSGTYSSRARIEEQIQEWIDGDSVFPPPWNDFEAVQEDRFPAYPVFRQRLNKHSIPSPRLSGSGSCLWLPSQAIQDREDQLKEEVREVFGPQARLFHTHLK
jgi:4-diphosphocytidyl-2C-methyl-D-erythritol kinase